MASSSDDEGGWSDPELTARRAQLLGGAGAGYASDSSSEFDLEVAGAQRPTAPTTSEPVTCPCTPPSGVSLDAHLEPTSPSAASAKRFWDEVGNDLNEDSDREPLPSEASDNAVNFANSDPKNSHASRVVHRARWQKNLVAGLPSEQTELWSELIRNPLLPERQELGDQFAPFNILSAFSGHLTESFICKAAQSQFKLSSQ